MVRTRALRFLLILGLVALLIPVSLAQADSDGGSGTAVVRDAVILGDPFAGDIPVIVNSGKVTLAMTGVEEPAENTALEGWLVTDDGSRKQSLGILEVSQDGSVNHEYEAEENLLLTFNTFAITLEPVPDDEPDEPSSEITHVGIIDGDVLEQIRLLLDPMGPAAAVNLRAKARMSDTLAKQARAAIRNGNLEEAKTRLGEMNAVIAGTEEDPGIALLAEQVVEAATMAGEDAGEDMAVGNASDATATAANSAASGIGEAMMAASRAIEAESDSVAMLEIGNVVAHTSDAKSQAELAYSSTQDMGTYSVISGDAVRDLSVGEPIIAQIVRYGLIASIVLVLAGSVMFLGSRRRSGASAA